jgi:hypothetical protein
MKKPKFNPIVTRVKLNPEQAVLACSCFNTRNAATVNRNTSIRSICQSGASTFYCNRSTNSRNATST